MGDEETRSAASIAAPLITPSRQSTSPSSINMSISSDPVVHPETSKETYLNKQQVLSTSTASTFQQEQQPQPLRSTALPEAPAHQKLRDTKTSSNVLQSNGISNSNRSMQETSVQKTYKYSRMKTENTAYVSEQEDERSEAFVRESLNDLYSKFQENSPTEAQMSNYHFYPQIVAKPEEFYVMLTKSTDLPTMKLPRNNSSEPKETAETLDIDMRRKPGKLYDDKITTKPLSAYEM